jgi:ribosome assembly protein RRB1
LSKKPVHTIDQHKGVEGFGLAWGGQIGLNSEVRLLSGDLRGKIFRTTLSPSGFVTNPSAFTSHTQPVEDICWSPNEMTVFGSCSSDRSIKIWDVRVRERKSVISVDRAHESDVNVMDWNKSSASNYLLISGGDEGGIKVWDLRSFTK